MLPLERYREAVQELEALQVVVAPLQRLQLHAAWGAAPAGSKVEGGADTSDGGGGGAMPAAAAAHGCSTREYRPADYGGGSYSSVAQQHPTDAAAVELAQLRQRLLEKDARLFDAELRRDQAVAEGERHRRRLHALLTSLSLPPQGGPPSAALAEACAAAGLPLPTTAAGSKAAPARQQQRGQPPVRRGGVSKSGTGGGSSSSREQDLLDTVAMLRSALERAQKGLESGVSSAKYMAAVERGKQLRERCRRLEEEAAGAERVRQELARVQQQVREQSAECGTLRAQLAAAARERQAGAASAREAMLRAQVHVCGVCGVWGVECVGGRGDAPWRFNCDPAACCQCTLCAADSPSGVTPAATSPLQVGELERALGERDAQMEALQADVAQVDEEVRVLVAEGLRPADLIQELLRLRWAGSCRAMWCAAVGCEQGCAGGSAWYRTGAAEIDRSSVVLQVAGA